VEEVSKALSTTTNRSALGPSGIRYKILKWAHEACPDIIPTLLTNCLNSGIHPWKKATVVMLNKPKKLDYSVPKAYWPIALMECAGKLLEKIVAKRINDDIETYNLLPMTQYGSRPWHNTMDTIACLVHKIQGTIKTGHAGALLLFDIAGFFDHINPQCTVAILRNKGFPPMVCEWMLSFLTGREVAIKIGDYSSEPFPILGGTPQGSPLSPILSALYTSSLLKAAKQWDHSDLSLYVDDGAIYSVSKMLKAATEKAVCYHGEVLTWLEENSLSIDPSKSELMTFIKNRANQNLTGLPVLGVRYMIGNNPARITNTTHACYLGVYIDHRLNCTRHIEVMSTQAQSDIRSLSILGNSVWGLDFLNWHKAYNAIIIPGMTYGSPIWYKGSGQKDLVQRCHRIYVWRLGKANTWTTP
jgi:hypothetical protein